MGIEENQNYLNEYIRKLEPEAVLDGVISEEEYLKTKYKILYVLKEANGGKSWSLIEFLKNRARASTWDNIARWTEGILNLDKEMYWDCLERDNEKRRKNYLKKIAVVNLKKISGGCISDKNEIANESLKNKNIIKKQVEIINPDIIVCCGTSKWFCDIYENNNIKWEITSRGIWYFRYNGKIIISYLHPETRVKNCLLYYGLIDAVREIIQNE